MKISHFWKALVKLLVAALHAARLLFPRHTYRRSMVIVFALLLNGAGLPAGRAQTMETITNSIIAIEGLLSNVTSTQEVVYAGDMGFSPSDLLTWTRQLRQKAGLPTGPIPKAVFVSSSVWPNGVVPYTYSINMPIATSNMFEAAIGEWQQAANLNFIHFTGHPSGPNYILVQTNKEGNSEIGMAYNRGQTINLDSNADLAECEHEIGHALGMLHEQSRPDRDTYVKIHWANFLASLGDPRTNINFAIFTNATSFGPYDYASVEHYPKWDGHTARIPPDPACDDPGCIQIEPLEPYYSAAGSPDLYYGARNLSGGDKVGMAATYGTPRTISGHVANGLNGPFYGVTVTISGGSSYRGPAAVTTDVYGNFSFTGIPNNSGLFVITPTLSGHFFYYPAWNVTVGTNDYSGILFTDADNSPPTITIDSPVNTSYQVAPAVSGSAADTNGIADTGVAQVNVAFSRTSDNVWWNFGDRVWGTTVLNPLLDITPADGTNSWSNFLPADLADGEYEVQVQAVDNAANASLWITRKFTIDNTPPILAFTPLTNNASVFDLSGIGGSINEAGAVRFRIEQVDAGATNYWNGSKWVSDPSVYLAATVTGGNWTPAGGVGLLNRGQTRSGPYRLRVMGTDVAGNVGTLEIVVNRSAPDTTPPLVTLDNLANGAVLTNQFLPTLAGSATDPESGITLVQVHLYRYSNGAALYWNGSAWDSTPAELAVFYNPTNAAWQVNSPLPSGTDLPNGGYGVEVYALNGEVSARNRDLFVNFSVDYHPVYVFTYGSQNQPYPNQSWTDGRNWSVGSVPTSNAWVIINNFSPDNTGLGNIPLYRLDIQGGQLTTYGMELQMLNLSGGTLAGGTITIAGNGVCNWSGGTLNSRLTIPTNATFNIEGAADKSLSQNITIDLAGNATWSGQGNVNTSAGSGLTNNGTFTVLNDALVTFGGGAPQAVFVNNGTFAKGAGTKTTFTASNNGMAFNNNGTIDVQSGLLALGGGGHRQQRHLPRRRGGPPGLDRRLRFRQWQHDL